MQPYTGPVASHEQIEAAVKAHNNHTRFRDLLNPSHPDYNPNYNSLVISIATGKPISEINPPPPANPYKAAMQSVMASNHAGRAELQKHARNRTIAESCPYRDKCGCDLARCFAHLGNAGLSNSYSTTDHCASCMADCWQLAK